jgi:hypothetical protein
MATETNQPVRKVAVTLPVSLLARLDDKVPSRRRSAFIARAIEEQLAIVEQAGAIKESAGVWRDKDYSDMATEEEMDRWLAELRGPADERPIEPYPQHGQL